MTRTEAGTCRVFRHQEERDLHVVEVHGGGRGGGVELRWFWAARAAPPSPPSPGDREVRACSPWQPPQGSLESHPIGDFLKQFVAWEFMDF